MSAGPENGPFVAPAGRSRKVRQRPSRRAAATYPLTMAKMRRFDSKAALSQQRAELRRSAPGRVHVGDFGGADAARKRKHEEIEQLHQRMAEEQQQADQRAHDRAALWPLVMGLARDTYHLARALAVLPFRIVQSVVRS